MKNILIIYPHWPPSNLAGIHRARLISNFLPEFGWHPIVLAVKPEYYEEKPDPDIGKTVRSTTEVHLVDAKPINSINRLIGDIALRSFSTLKKKALELLEQKKVDFIWIPIPSFYTAILGRLLHDKTNVPYGIDYIDPWVDSFVGQEKVFSKAWLSNQLAKVLEPYAVKKASLISGVATSYYGDVLQRNFKNRKICHVGMPYGFDPSDHEIKLDAIEYPWDKYGDEVIPYIYAGAFLPKSHLFLELLLKNIQKWKRANEWDEKIKFFFVGTGNYPGKTIADYAKEYTLEDTVIEIKQRFPFLHVLNFLNKASGIVVLGSVEEHYTASKIFQSLLSKKPVFAIFHYRSSVVDILEEVNADDFLVEYKPGEEEKLENTIGGKLKEFLKGENWKPQLNRLQKYSAKASAKKLVDCINGINQ